MALHLPFAIDPSAVLILGSSAVSIAAVGGYSVYNHLKNSKQASESRSRAVIQQHVKHQLRMGKELPEVKLNLVKQGHDEKLVRDVMGTLELYKYVYHSMKQGHDSLRVKHALTHWGWEEEHVNKAIVHASNRILRQKYEQKHVTI